jgi:threonine/homoserine/homoserine lactone efflux protein
VTDALGQLLGSGVGVALSPIPVIAVILMLTTARGRVTGVAFMLGWLVGLSAATGIVLLLANGSDEAGSTTADGAHFVTLVVGLLFLALAGLQWRRRPEGHEPPELPAWMAGIDGFGAPKCFALGALLSGVNPKNLALAVSAGVALAETGSTGGATALGAAVFVIVGSVTVAGPVIGSLIAPARIGRVLAEAKTWLADHNSTIMIVLFLILGATRTGEGLASLMHG